MLLKAGIFNIIVSLQHLTFQQKKLKLLVNFIYLFFFILNLNVLQRHVRVYALNPPRAV